MAARLKKWRPRFCWSKAKEEEDEGHDNYEDYHEAEDVHSEDDDNENVEEAAQVVQEQKIEGVILSKKPSIVLLSHLSSGDGTGIGIIIRHNLVLTSHGTIPSVQSAKEGEVAIHYAHTRGGCCPTQTTIKQKLLPLRFFITSRAMDMTVVACQDISPVVAIEPCAGGRMQAGSKAYILGAAADRPSARLRLGSVVVRSDNGTYVTFDTFDDFWLPGSAGFDNQGQFAFMACQPQHHHRQHPSGVSVTEILSWLDDHLPGDDVDELEFSNTCTTIVPRSIRDEEAQEVSSSSSKGGGTSKSSRGGTSRSSKSKGKTSKALTTTKALTARVTTPDVSSQHKRSCSAVVTPIVTQPEGGNNRRIRLVRTPSTGNSSRSSSRSSGSSKSSVSLAKHRSSRSSLSLSKHQHSPPKTRRARISVSPKPPRMVSVSPNPRMPGVSYSVPSSPNSGLSSRTPSIYNRPSSPARFDTSGAQISASQLEDLIGSPECSSESDAGGGVAQQVVDCITSRHGRAQSVESTKKHIFRSGEVSESSDVDDDVYVGVGYRKRNMPVARVKAIRKGKTPVMRKRKDRAAPGCTAWQR